MGQERGRKEEKLPALPFCSPLLCDTQINYIFAFHFIKATMRRLGPLRLMTSHTHLYAKLDEFGKDFNAAIKKRVSDECQYLNMHHQPPLTTCTSLELVNPQASSTTDGLLNPQRATSSLGQRIPLQATSTTPGLVNLEQAPSTLQQMQTQAATNTTLGQVHPQPATSPLGQEQLQPALTGTMIQPGAEQPGHNDQVILQPDHGRKITFDNFDIYQEVHHMTEQHQNKDKHYVTVMSTENRISGAHLRRNEPVCDIATLENGKCVPNQTDHQKQKENYVVLVSRILTANIPCLKHLEEAVTKHIPHRYQMETAQATNTVSNDYHVTEKPNYTTVNQLELKGF